MTNPRTVKSLKAAHAAAEVFLVGIITKKRYVNCHPKRRCPRWGRR